MGLSIRPSRTTICSALVPHTRPPQRLPVFAAVHALLMELRSLILEGELLQSSACCGPLPIGLSQVSLSLLVCLHLGSSSSLHKPSRSCVACLHCTLFSQISRASGRIVQAVPTPGPPDSSSLSSSLWSSRLPQACCLDLRAPHRWWPRTCGVVSSPRATVHHLLCTSPSSCHSLVCRSFACHLRNGLIDKFLVRSQCLLHQLFLLPGFWPRSVHMRSWTSVSDRCLAAVPAIPLAPPTFLRQGVGGC